MRSLKKPAMMVGAATVLTALALSWTSPAFAEDAPPPPSTDTSTSAPASTSTPESTATQTPAPAPEEKSQDAPVAPQAQAKSATVQNHPSKPFDWNWQYPAPTCQALTVTYPSDEPAGQTNDVNIRVQNLGSGGGEVTLNFHNNSGTWSGTQAFVLTDNPSWPGWTYYQIVWTQVGGTNYHWQGTVVCGHSPPTPKVCSNSGSLTWTKNANLSEATVTLKQGFDSCDVSLNSYETQGATWETSGTQTFVDHATAHLTKDNPTAKLTVKVQGCFQQQDLYIGTTRYDGKDGALPHYPDSNVPTGLIDHWNGAVDCTPPPPTPKVCTTITTGPKATNLDANGWYQSDTRATGKVSFVAGGVNFQTTDSANPGSSQNKATLYRAITPTPLSEFGEPSVTFADGGSGVKPGMQVGIDVDGNGTWDGYLVGEPWSYGDHNWWVNKPGFNVPGGMGYTSFGSWADFVAANPNAKVIELGLSLGSGVLGNWTVTNLTAGCTSYTFDYVTPTTPVSGTPTITVTGPTCESPYNTINYNIPEGLSVNGFTGTGSIRAEDYPDARGDGSSIYGHWSVPVVVQDGFSYNGPSKLEFDLVNPASLDCTVPTVTPENVWFHDSCGVTDDSVNVPGTLDGTPSVTTDPVTGDVVTRSSYTSSQGVYVVVDTTTKAGVRTAEVTFSPSGDATVAEPGADDTYKVVTIDGVKYAQWTYTFRSASCGSDVPPTTPPTHPVTPAGHGGVNTGLSGSEPGAHSAAANFSASWGIGGFAFALLAAFALFMVFRPKRTHELGEAGVEKP